MKRSKQQGIGLIEVLITVLLLAIGILGMAAMQLSAKRAGYEAVQRTLATALARDIAARMRVNPAALDSYVVNNLGGGSIGTEPTPNCSSSTCNAAQLAAHDLWEWEQALDGATETISAGGTTSNAGGLVSPRACITHSSGEVTVAIAWKGYESIGNPTASTCGEGLGLYETNEVNRQLLVVSTYIQDI